jgi:aspartate aminotransferase-like enzyme
MTADLSLHETLNLWSSGRLSWEDAMESLASTEQELVALAHEFGFKVPDTAEEAMRKRLRLHHVPWAEGFDEASEEEYAAFLEMPQAERRKLYATMTDEASELYVVIEIARMEFEWREKRFDGITQEKIDAHPEWYSPR